MSDFSGMSDADLMAALNKPQDSGGLSKMSDADLMKALGTGGWQDTAKDVAASAGTGLVKGTAGLLTAPQGIKDMLGTIADQPIKGINYLMNGKYELPERPQNALDQMPSMPRQHDVVSAVENNVTGPLHKPTTQAGKYTETMSEFVPGALAGPGNFIRNVARYAVVPGAASEAAGQATAGTKYEPWARGAAAITGMGASALASRPGSPGGVMQEAMGHNVGAPEIQAAQQIMENAAQRGIQLTWPEAIQQVTNSGTKLADVQRVVEGSQRGGAVMRPVMAERPGQVDTAIRGQIDQIAPNAIDPFTVGPRTAEAATGAVNDVRTAINNHTRPLYDASRHDLIPEAQYQALANDPRYVAALREIRGNPELAAEFHQFPDNAVPVVSQVSRLLRTRAEVTPMSDATERYLGSLRGEAGHNAENAATTASVPYAQATAEQAQLRGQYLTPVEQGPIGRTAAVPTTEGAVNTLLPDAPLAGSAPQTGQAFRAIGMRDADAASNVVRQKLEGTLNQSARDLQGGPNEWGGANFRARTYGNPQAQENMRTAVTETAGPQQTQRLDQLMEVLQATGRRQHPGSQTEFNRLMSRALEGGGPVGEVLSSAAKLNPLSSVKDTYSKWRYGANTDRLAQMLLDPAMADRLTELAARNHGHNTQTRALLAQILAGDPGSKRTNIMGKDIQ